MLFCAVLHHVSVSVKFAIYSESELCVSHIEFGRLKNLFLSQHTTQKCNAEHKNSRQT